MSSSRTSIFISYSHADSFAAHTLATKLREVGYLPWVDFTGIVGGTEWRQSIESALRTSSAFLVLLSPDAVASEWVGIEIRLARSIRCPIIPLMIRKCEPPKELESIQFIDFSRDLESSFNELQRSLLYAILVTRPSDDAVSSVDVSVSDTVTETTQLHMGTNPVALVIEDVAYYASFLRDIMVESGLEVDIARTRNEAISLIREREYAFITLDMQLGPSDELREEELGQDGLYMLSRLKRYQPQAPIVIISSLDWGSSDDHRIASRDQVKGILRKPLDENAQDELASIVQKHISRRSL